MAGVVGMFGFAVSAWRPSATAAVVPIVLAVSFFADLLAPLFDLPDAVRYLSIFRLYGQPLTVGVAWGDVVVMLALDAAFLLVGSQAFTRRDIERG
jgi:putative exporter of polyketide antibiotics